ncbi:hypothetical protein ACIBF5_30645 [Micromonospora sp. NPDC050417]|uniref:hypothetical protein n=1 Tax=Micromonospora sp. NPDC050417 TaxID=3364280 RepID=UPI0037A04C45
MKLRSHQAARKRALGTTAIVAALLISVLAMPGDSASIEPYILAFLLVLTGIGLRIEVAINESRI